MAHGALVLSFVIVHSKVLGQVVAFGSAIVTALKVAQQGRLCFGPPSLWHGFKGFNVSGVVTVTTVHVLHDLSIGPIDIDISGPRAGFWADYTSYCGVVKLRVSFQSMNPGDLW